MNMTEKLIELSRSSPKTFGAVQQQAAVIFETKGLPALKDEEWKYTNIRPLFEKNYALNPALTGVPLERIIIQFPFLIDGIVIALVNGKTIEIPDKKLPEGLKAEVINQHNSSEWFNQHFARLASVEKDSLTALNTSLMSECLMISVAAKTEISTPVYLLNISSSSSEPAMTYGRLLIHAGKHSKADITLLNVSDNEQSETFDNLVTEIYAA